MGTEEYLKTRLLAFSIGKKIERKFSILHIVNRWSAIGVWRKPQLLYCAIVLLLCCYYWWGAGDAEIFLAFNRHTFKHKLNCFLALLVAEQLFGLMKFLFAFCAAPKIILNKYKLCRFLLPPQIFHNASHITKNFHSVFPRYYCCRWCCFCSSHSRRCWVHFAKWANKNIFRWNRSEVFS